MQIFTVTTRHTQLPIIRNELALILIICLALAGNFVNSAYAGDGVCRTLTADEGQPLDDTGSVGSSNVSCIHPYLLID